MVSRDYRDGFKDGYNAAQDEAQSDWSKEYRRTHDLEGFTVPTHKFQVAKRKRKQTGKAKILTDMARPIWNKYKKGSGKKTYFDIRSQVRRSNAYRKRVKNL